MYEVTAATRFRVGAGVLKGAGGRPTGRDAHTKGRRHKGRGAGGIDA